MDQTSQTTSEPVTCQLPQEDILETSFQLICQRALVFTGPSLSLATERQGTDAVTMGKEKEGHGNQEAKESVETVPRENKKTKKDMGKEKEGQE